MRGSDRQDESGNPRGTSIGKCLDKTDIITAGSNRQERISFLNALSCFWKDQAGMLNFAHHTVIGTHSFDSSSTWQTNHQ
jgi:hypothetical protein